MSDDPDRRTFLKVATCGLGGALGIAAAAPAISLVLEPVSRQTVTTPKDPIDIGDATSAEAWKTWQKVDVIAPQISDGWTTVRNTILGAAFVRNSAQGFQALSGICPHLGCAVSLQTNGAFGSPCHNSVFSPDGDAQKGPSKRGLDPLPIEIKDGRLRLTWLRYKLDTGSREPA